MRYVDVARRMNARQLAYERRSPSWPMNAIRPGVITRSSEPDMKIIHRSAEAESAESDRRNLGKPPPGAGGRSLDDDNAVVRRCLARMRERQARYDREQAMRDDDE